MEEYVWISKLAHHPVFSSHAHNVLERLGSHYGVRITIAGPDDAATPPYVQAIHDAVARKAAGIMLIGWGEPAAVSAVSAAVDSGIPVVTVDSDIPGSKRLAHVGTDWFRMGWSMALKLAELLADRGRVLMIGMRNLANMEAGFRGFLAQMALHPQIEVLGPEDDLDVGFDKARSVVARYLKRNGDLGGVAGFDGNSGPGAAIALEEAGKQHAVRLVCVDADEAQLEHIRTGAIDTAFCQRREAFTYLAFQLLYAYNHGSPATGNRPGAINIPGNIDTGHLLVTLDNIDSFESELNLDEAFEHHKLSQQIGLLSSMVENAADITLATDTGGRIAYANPAAVRTYGYAEEEIKELGLEDLFDLKDEQLALCRRCVSQRDPVTFETLAVKSDGQTVPVQLSLSPLLAETTVRGMVAVAADLTAHKSIEDRLRKKEETERSFRTRLEALHEVNIELAGSESVTQLCRRAVELARGRLGFDRIGLWFADEDEPNVFVGSFGTDESGRLRDERGRRITPVQDPLLMQVTTKELPLGFREETVLRDDHGEPAGTGARAIAPLLDGEKVVGLISTDNLIQKQPITKEQTELLKLFASSVGNLYARKRTEEERNRLATAVEQTDDAIAIMDTEEKIEYVNPAFERITGYSRSEAVEKNVPLVRTAPRDSEMVTKMWRTLAGGKVWSGRYTNRRKDGDLYEEEATISPLRDEAGDIIKYVAVQSDVTEQILLEEQLQQSQKLEAVGRLAGGIAHDFNNQLTVVKGYCELLLQDLSPQDPSYPQIREIHKAATRSASLTSQLLAFSHKQILHPQVFNLNHILADLADPLGRMIEENIHLSIDPGDDLGNIEADPIQVRQVIMNLVVNARDALPRGGGLTLETRNVTLDRGYVAQHVGSSPGPHVMLSVTDTGVGMDEETRRQIFEPFFTTKPIGRGTGLGLAMVHGFVRQSGGHVTISTELACGTTVRIYLPRVSAELTTQEPLVGPAAARGGSETVLVVEDDESVRGLIASFLRRRGYTVLEAGGAREAVPLAEHYEGPIDLLVTDLVMPDLGGTELADLLRHTRRDLPVLYITGYADRAPDHLKLPDRRQQLLTKPFDPPELVRIVRSLLDAGAESNVLPASAPPAGE